MSIVDLVVVTLYALAVIVGLAGVDANGQSDRVSILAPVGSALLGLRVGDTIQWPMPGRTLQLKVLSIRYQPEASGELHR